MGRLVLTLIVLCVLTGCAGRKQYPVKGTVVWPDGKPAKELAGGMVQFDRLPDETKVLASPRGKIEEDGSYQLGMLKDGDGAPPGKYRVLVMPLVWTEGMLRDKPAPPPILDPRFQQFETAKIEVVVEAKDNDIPIPVEKVKKR